MGQFLQVNGDYNIKAGEGAKITLDTGPATSGGSVRITGNLVVEGETLAIGVEDLTIEDNIIVLNKGEVGPGITLDYSGIEIDRGDTSSITPQNNASLLYDEATDAWMIVHGTAPGPFNFDESNLRVKRILTNASTDSGDLTLIGTGTGVVKVIGTDNYEDQVTHDDDIPNKRYVDESIVNNPTFQIVARQSEDTKVIITDKDVTPNDVSEIGSPAHFEDQTGYTTNGESAVSFIVDDNLVVQVYSDRVLFGQPGTADPGLEISENQLRTKDYTDSYSANNVYVRTGGTGKLQTNYGLQLDQIGTTPNYVSNSTVIYAADPGIGTSGVWFVNDSTEVAKRNGELISKNKALVFSMLF